ncbi:MAG: PD-(D/E)XK nuclease family protein [Flavobacteriales bacterium]
MNKFSDILAEKLIATHGDKFDNVMVVLPALQAGSALLQSLRKRSTGAMWLPEMVVMPEFVFRLSGKKTASPVDLMLLLFEAYSNTVSNPDDFATFCSWSAVVLKDFQDIDQYLADSSSLFVNLRNIEEIDHWSLSNEVLTPSQEKYLGFWSEMGLTHQKFNALREERDIWSYGALVRKLPEWKAEIERVMRTKSVWFVGLTALTPAEEQMVFMLEEFCDVHICWDVDPYYFNDPMNEAGSYLRRFAKRKMMDLPFTSSMSAGARTIEIVETATPAGEVFALCEMLRNVPAEEYNSTAVVLADSGLIQHLLRALHDQQIPVQTAMGIPVRNLLQGQWVGLLLQLKAPPGKGKIHFKTLLEWLALSAEFELSNEAFTQIKNEVTQEVIIYPGPQHCKDLLQRFAPDWKWNFLIEPSLSPVEFLHHLRNLFLEYHKTSRQDALKSSVSVSILSTLDELIRLMDVHPFTHSFEVIKTIWQQLSSREEIRFESALQDGIKVLSMVETRGLDFDNLYILGANEDRFPGNSQEQTFIPWDVRGIFHLPLPDEREATFAYNFYRLIQRPSSIHFLHSSINADYKSSEPSRFIAQLNYEWPFRNKSVQWFKRFVRLEAGKNALATERMPNNDFVHKRLDELFSAGLSPSAMGKFNRCPLDFYYRYIIGLGENEEMEERMSAATFGSVIHDVLEHFYRDFIDSYPQDNDFDLLIADLKNKLQEAFGRLYSSSGISSGLNLLSLEVAAEMLTGYLRSEKSRSNSNAETTNSISIREIEFWMERDLPVDRFGWKKPIRLRGKGDRVEEIAGKHCIIDYKTGKVAPEDYTMKQDIADVVFAADRGKLLQLLTYIYMYAAKGHDPANITAGFFSFVRPSAGYSFLENAGDPAGSNAWIPAFEEAVVEWVRKTYEMPHFEHNPDSEYCQYCMS